MRPRSFELFDGGCSVLIFRVPLGQRRAYAVLAHCLGKVPPGKRTRSQCDTAVLLLLLSPVVVSLYPWLHKRIMHFHTCTYSTTVGDAGDAGDSVPYRHPETTATAEIAFFWTRSLLLFYVHIGFIQRWLLSVVLSRVVAHHVCISRPLLPWFLWHSLVFGLLFYLLAQVPAVDAFMYSRRQNPMAAFHAGEKSCSTPILTPHGKLMFSIYIVVDFGKATDVWQVG